MDTADKMTRNYAEALARELEPMGMGVHVNANNGIIVGYGVVVGYHTKSSTESGEIRRFLAAHGKGGKPTHVQDKDSETFYF